MLSGEITGDDANEDVGIDEDTEGSGGCMVVFDLMGSPTFFLAQEVVVASSLTEVARFNFFDRLMLVLMSSCSRLPSCSVVLLAESSNF